MYLQIEIVNDENRTLVRQKTKNIFEMGKVHEMHIK